MKLLHQLRLHRFPDTSRVLELSVHELPLEHASRFAVHLREMRGPQSVREVSPSVLPVDLDQAQQSFSRLGGILRSGGWLEIDEIALLQRAEPIPAVPVDAAARSALLAGLVPARWKLKDDSARSRWVWRIGQLRIVEAVPRLIELLESGSAMLDYCIAWTLARCADRGALLAIQELQRRARSDMVRRMAGWAELELLTSVELQQRAQLRMERWSPELRAAWQRCIGGDPGEFAALLARPEYPIWPAAGVVSAWPDLELCTRDEPLARSVWLAHLAAQPLQAGTFRGWRRLYKLAELREDWTLLGLLAERIEAVRRAFFRDEKQSRINGIRSDKELTRDDSRLAFSDRTQNYFCRRNWRLLRRLATEQPGGFIELAAAFLAGFDDGKARPPFQRNGYRRVAGGPYEHTIKFYGPFARALTYNQLLFQQSQLLKRGRSGQVSHVMIVQARGRGRGEPLTHVELESGRLEAFPALWDQAPQTLLRLLFDARAQDVQKFAGRALLMGNFAWCNTVPAQVWGGLLDSPVEHTRAFAAEQLRIQLHGSTSLAAKVAILQVMVSARSANAPLSAQDEIARERAAYAAFPALLLSLLTAPLATIREQGRILAADQAVERSQAGELLAGILDWLTVLDPALPELPAICASLETVLSGSHLALAKTAPQERLVALLSQTPDPVLRLAAFWLALHPPAVARVPLQLFIGLLEDGSPVRRSAGVLLFAALPMSLLLGQIDLLVSFSLSADAQVRAAVVPALHKLAAEGDNALVTKLRDGLLDALFRSEVAEGQHADWLDWLCGPFAASTRELPLETVWRLLMARSRGAQLLGAWCLPHWPAAAFSVRQWALLGNHADADVRAWALAAFRADPQRAASELDQALILCDSHWVEVRQFAHDYFTTQFSAADWTVDRLILLCDHPVPAIQELGQALLQRHVPIADAGIYLLRLSQHPSARMQGLVSRWLERHADADLSVLVALRPYFLTVLCAIQRGRPVKNRVQTFIRTQGLRSLAHAQWVCSMLSELVLTVAIADQAHYLATLSELQRAWPELRSPVRAVAAPLRASQHA